ncbi:MerR family transcriptional regulator [Chungangia koreensis]|uniref:MerR family transcriptional regulator n=1 Tax=Chungangia koreensis TaxID=752657 RepID=A0ABV8X562_9LACT
MLSIGRMARLFGITSKTIKHYEEVGLLQPAYVNPDNGYRYYAYAQQQRLQQICLLRSFGVSLNDIKEMDKTGMKHILKSRLTAIEVEISALEEMKGQIIYQLGKGEEEMDIRFETIEPFIVSGFEHKGLVKEIPQVWVDLNNEYSNLKSPAEQSFGVCLSGDGQQVHYVAAYERELWRRTDLQDVEIEGGRYVVAKVDGGIPNIPTTFDYITKMDDLEFRDAPDFERYIHPIGSTVDEIEIWVPIR